MDLSYQRRLAAEILGVGESKIKFDESAIDRIEGAVTKDEIRRLIKDGVIYVEPVKSNSRGRWREFHEERKSGRHRGQGKRKGSVGARAKPREMWISRIRKIRRFLKWLRDNGVIDKRTYRMLYRKAKGGAFDSLSSLKRYMRDQNILPQSYR
ncbi:50S ribosomal protein L19e [Ignisphaera sp. 4213-co]|uniref:Large ribosomal subunit protein eL19 n=1 Tax=Ignisphaera cupida TaxID=3050454 RepID=A0ABD4Z3P3_9CREN|nr:50S ribosomal protein L19e [Ignisphaera sp. 4213-co]MDK6027941.1 50S ribosomal protein L19e [Ignisphaera sp. 4213-co]